MVETTLLKEPRAILGVIISKCDYRTEELSFF